MLAAVIGAAAGVAGAWAVSVIRPGSIATIQQDGSIEQRISAVEQELSVRIAAMAPKTDVAALAERLTALNQQLAALSDRTGAEIRALAARPPNPGSSGAQVENDATGAAALKSQIAALESRLGGVEQAAREANALAGAVSGQIRTLDEAVRKVDPAAAQMAAQQAARLAEQAGARIGSIDARLNDLTRQVAGEANDQRIAALAQAVAAADALTAIRNGRPLPRATASLAGASLAAAGGGSSATPLMSVETGGVATLARLQHDFAAVRDRLAALQHQNEGVLDRLTASASRLVRVRPIDQEGRPVADAEGSVDRVSDMLAAGNLTGAETAWRALPQALRDAAPDFGAALSARVNAERAARGALDAALATLAQQDAAKPAQPGPGRSDQGSRR